MIYFRNYGDSSSHFFTLIAVPADFVLEREEKVQIIDYDEKLNSIQLNAGIIEIRAVDSSYFEILTRDEAVIRKITSKFVKYEIL